MTSRRPVDHPFQRTKPLVLWNLDECPSQPVCSVSTTLRILQNGFSIYCRSKVVAFSDGQQTESPERRHSLSKLSLAGFREATGQQARKWQQLFSVSSPLDSRSILSSRIASTQPGAGLLRVTNLIQVLKQHLIKRPGLSPGTVVLIGGEHPGFREMTQLVRKAGCPCQIYTSRKKPLRQAATAGPPLLDWQGWLRLQFLLLHEPRLLNLVSFLDSGQRPFPQHLAKKSVEVT